MSDSQNGDEQLAGTVKLYRRHVVVLTAEADWPSHLDQADGLPGASAGCGCGTRATASAKSRSPPPPATRPPAGTTCWCFPDMVRYCAVGAEHPDVDIAALVEDHLVGGRVSTRLVNEPLAGHHLFVCVHAARDQRCGDQGPELAVAVERELSGRGMSDVTVRRSQPRGRPPLCGLRDRVPGRRLVRHAHQRFGVPVGGPVRSRQPDARRALARPSWHGPRRPARNRSRIRDVNTFAIGNGCELAFDRNEAGHLVSDARSHSAVDDTGSDGDLLDRDFRVGPVK